MKKDMFLLLALMMLSVMNVYAQKVSFKADITTMIPMRYTPQYGLSSYGIEMKDDTVTVHLPYIGNVYNPSYNNDGLNFTEPCKNLKVKDRKKKDGKVVSFKVRHDNVGYEFQVTLFDNNNCSVFMNPNNGDSCNYDGELIDE